MLQGPYLGRLLRLGAVAIAVCLGSAAGGRAAGITETIRQTDQFDTLAKVMEAAGGLGWLAEEEQVTFFAPTDAAFDNLSEGMLDRLLEPEHEDELELLLEHHLVPGQALSSAALPDHTRLEMAEGEPLLIGSSGGTITIGDATLVQPDIRTDNGIIHAIDEVLVPELVWNMLERSN